MAATDIEMTSPVRPMIAANYDQDHAYGFPAYQSEVDICQLLQAMSLSKGKFKKGSRGRSNSLCPICIAKCKRARCKHGGLGIPFRRVGVIKLKVQLLRATPHRLPSHVIRSRPTILAPRMPLPPIHPRFSRPRVPRSLSVPLPIPHRITFPDNERRLPGHNSAASQSSRRLPSSSQGMRSDPSGDRQGT